MARRGWRLSINDHSVLLSEDPHEASLHPDQVLLLLRRSHGLKGRIGHEVVASKMELLLLQVGQGEFRILGLIRSWSWNL